MTLSSWVNHGYSRQRSGTMTFTTPSLLSCSYSLESERLQNMVESLQDVLPTLVRRLRRLGTDTVKLEVKSAAGGLPKSTSETLSAFANGDGGVLLLGLDEATGFLPAPGFDAQRIADALARVCHEDMEPPIRDDVEMLEFEDALVVGIDVSPLDPTRGPSHLKRKGAYEGSFIRGGDGDRRLTAYEVTQVLANHGQPRDDAEIVSQATIDDLQGARVAALLARLRAKPTRAFADVDDERALIRIGALGVDSRGVVRPTLAGILCLGAYPQQFAPQLFISFVALPGSQLGDSLDDGTRFLDNVTCDGTIPEILETLIAAARRNMRTAAVIHGRGREDRYDYPTEVIRELVVNALLHRDYSAGSRGTQVQVELFPDRLVVKSPGGLYGNVVPSQLGVEEISSTRNAFLAKLLAEIPDSEGMPVSENRGSGLPRVMTRLRRAGMTPPTFDISPGHVHVTVPQHALLDPPTVEWIAALPTAPGLTNEQHIALAQMRSTGTVSNEMLRAWGVDSHAATVALRDLVDRGLALKFGGRRYATYELVDDPERRLDVRVIASGEHRPGVRARRIESELQAVIECVRAGSTTVGTIGEQLGLSYATTTRRVNTLLAQGRLLPTAPPHSRNRTFVLPDQ